MKHLQIFHWVYQQNITAGRLESSLVLALTPEYGIASLHRCACPHWPLPLHGTASCTTHTYKYHDGCVMVGFILGPMPV